MYNPTKENNKRLTESKKIIGWLGWHKTLCPWGPTIGFDGN